ncbi:VirB4-like conjugal transfer ATPase, CD1110 family [Allofournierella massiliensis]|uniref:AAA domain-containing protein n=2 Tax=Allofournierella massiliensis TaxID=1650663 RepID=A0A4R1QIV2_9FIRM|nr:ATP-binding protein [Fournierella massiliensis]TCL53559.1 AAA domain-containing protein [Fournierella massiliensis]
MKLNEYASTRKTRGHFYIPRSVQQSIPVDEIFADGIWRSGEVFSQMWRISDINFSMLSDSNKRILQSQYGVVYAGIPSDCWAKFCITSQHMDEKSFRKSILYQPEHDGHDDLRQEKNDHLIACASDVGNVIQQKFLIISTVKRNVREARDRLRQIQGHLISSLSALGCTVTNVTCNERLEILHNFFRNGEEGHFQFDLSECQRLGNDFKSAVCPDTLNFKRSHIEIDGRFAKCMSISHFPQQLNDRFITTLLQQVPYIILSIDVVPVEPEDAMQALEEVRMAVDAEKARFNRRAVDKLDFTASIPPRTLAQEETMKRYYADITEDDQQMMLSMLSVAYFADSLEDLALETDALKTTAVNYNCRFTELFFQQEDAFNTAMPYGLRRLENVHTMVTKNVTALVPFNTQEVLVPGGIYYGVNDMSGNLIVGLRTELMNGNAMILATSGSGKSMFTKQEIMELFLRFPKARFYLVDPENEYRPLVEELGGIVVDISVESRTYLNPLEYKPEPGSDTLPNEAKVEFILSLCEQIMGKNNGYIGDKSIIDNSLRNIYAPYVKSNYEGDCPTLHDLWKDLKEQPLERAKEIALALEVYVNGSLSMFAKPTNVDMTNRLICFNIQSLGGQLKAVAMLYMLEFINTRVMTTERSSSTCATWVYFDEIYLLLQNELSAQFLFTSWKRFRKYNAFATGITQNIEDCLSNSTAYAMLANSEFVCMLRQTKDIDHVVELYGLSDIQRNYLLKARPGQGILKMGNALIPFVNDYPKNTKSYRLLTTKPGELENKSEGDSDE